MLTRLTLENYRAFDQLDIPLRKINLFFGPNNSGKSAIISAINLLAQTYSSDDSNIPLLLTGKFEDLGAYIDIVYGHSIDKDIKIGVEFDVDKEERPSRRQQKSLFDEDVSPERARFLFDFKYRPQRRQIILGGVQLYLPENNLLFRTQVAKTGERQIVEYLDPKFEKIKPRDLTYSLKYMHFLPWPEAPYPKKRRFYSASYVDLFLQFYKAAASMTKLLNGVEYLSPIRKKGERNYTFSGESPTSVGVIGDKAGQILAADNQLRGRKRQKIDEKISEWFSQAEIGKNICIKPLSPTNFEIRLVHPRSNESVNIADAGFGCSQILPVLVAGYCRPRNSTLIIEQPEIHLHPKAQAELGTLLCDFYKRDMQLFVETHSEHLLIRLQTHIAQGIIKPEDIAVFYVYANSNDKRKHAELIEMTNNGIFKGQWPEGFFPEAFEESRKLAKLAYRVQQPA